MASRIASRVRPSGASLNQTMLALYEANPEAFFGNMNLLRQGAVLDIPPAGQILDISERAASAALVAETARWRGDDGQAAAAASGSSASDLPARTDTGITAALRREITQRLEEKTAGDWDYDREPFDNPAEETGRFFRTTLNWFIMNMMADSGEYSGRLGRLVSDLEKKERYNRAAGAVDEEMLSKLIRAFESGSPSGFYTEKNVGVKGRNLGMLFDRISNHAYNRLLFPELAQFAPPGWGIEE